MIKTFKHKGLKYYFIEDEIKYLNKKHLKRIEQILDALDICEVIDDMNIPGFRLHNLKGSRSKIWSVLVSANWRITFSFENGNVYDVNLEDYL